MEDNKAKIGDKIRTKSGLEFIVKSQEIDEHGIQWVWPISNEEYKDEDIFSQESYGVPSPNFTTISSS